MRIEAGEEEFRLRLFLQLNRMQNRPKNYHFSRGN